MIPEELKYLLVNLIQPEIDGEEAIKTRFSLIDRRGKKKLRAKQIALDSMRNLGE